MFKKLFGIKPNVADSILGGIRARLVPLGFTESKGSLTGPVWIFKRDDLEVSLTRDDRDRMYYFETTKNKENIEASKGCEMDEDLNAFQTQVLQALDDWLKSI